MVTLVPPRCVPNDRERRPEFISWVAPQSGMSDARVIIMDAAGRGVLVSATKQDVARVIDIDVPVVRVRYELAEKMFSLGEIIDRHAPALNLATGG